MFLPPIDPRPLIIPNSLILNYFPLRLTKEKTILAFKLYYLKHLANFLITALYKNSKI